MMYSNPWMYSNKQMNVLKKEHGFLAYLDETFAEPDEIMHALLAGAMSTKSLGGELVIEFLSTRESNDSRKQSSCFLSGTKMLCASTFSRCLVILVRLERSQTRSLPPRY